VHARVMCNEFVHVRMFTRTCLCASEHASIWRAYMCECVCMRVCGVCTCVCVHACVRVHIRAGVCAHASKHSLLGDQVVYKPIFVRELRNSEDVSMLVRGLFKN